MTVPQPDSHWQDPHWQDPPSRISLADLAQACGLGADELQELVQSGALVPLADEGAGGPLQFSAGSIPALREAARLRSEHHLDLFTLGLLLGYLHRITHLEHQVHSLQSHQPHPQHLPRDGPAPWREPHA